MWFASTTQVATKPGELVQHTMRSFMVGSLAVALAAVPAAAQSRGHIAGMAPAPAATPSGQQVQQRAQYYPDAFIGYFPAMISGDGRVWANFGQGYEQVLRSCEAQYGYQYQPSYAAPTYTPPTYTPPSYSPPSYQTPGTTPAAPTVTTGSQLPLPGERLPSAPDPSAQAAPGMTPAQGATTSTRADARSTQGGGRVAALPDPASNQPTGPACWVSDAQGRVFVVRP